MNKKDNTDLTEEKTENSVKVEPTSAQESTERINAWSGLLNSIANVLKSFAPWLWALVVVIVIIPLVGQLVIAKSFNAPPPEKREVTIQVKSPDWNKVDEAIKNGLQTANENTKNYAEQELQTWVDDLITKVDPGFLDWYFGYVNQKEIEYKGFFTAIKTGVTNLIGLTNIGLTH